MESPNDDVDNRVKAILDDIKPLVLAQNFSRVCERLQEERDAAIGEGRLFDAASLSAMLGSFRSMTGDQDEALRALERAEELDANNPQRLVATAKYLFGRMGRKDDAKKKLEKLLGEEQVDAAARHNALALRGRIALAESRVEDAAEALAEAQLAATSGGLEAMFWDRALARELVDHHAAAAATCLYANALIERAESDVDEETKDEGATLLARLGREE